MEKIEQIRKVTTQVRSAMEELKLENKLEKYGYPYKNYPKGCCGDMSHLLTTHLYNLGFGVADYIWGYTYLGGDFNINHAWIRIDGICIDITADQFEWANFPKIIVEHEINYPLNKVFKSDHESTVNFIDDPELDKLYLEMKDYLSM